MPLLFSFIIFLALAVGVSYLGMKLYVRPKEAMERVTGATIEHQEITPTHPSLVFHDIVKRLGTLVPASPKDVTVMQRRLIRAGYRTPNALKMLYGAKAAFGVAFPVLAIVASMQSSAEQSYKIMAIFGAAAAGFFGPNEWVRMKAKRRQKEVQRGLANALDLLVVCVESGLGLDQAILQVSKELEHAHPEISEEFAIVNLELKAENGAPRRCAIWPTAPRSRILKNWWPFSSKPTDSVPALHRVCGLMPIICVCRPGRLRKRKRPSWV